ncbi:hypothetical protein E4U54_003154 [Claviceps lovelessii]|nr:hypothetical protein E4U54_003154 [Claviceps lovelessii]
MQLNVLLINLVALAASASCLAAGPAKRDAEIAARRTTPQDGTNPPIRDLACVKRCQDQQDMECVPLCAAFCTTNSCTQNCHAGCEDVTRTCLEGCP